MALASNVSMAFQAAQIPLLEGALECVRAGYIPGGLKANREFAECLVEYDDSVPERGTRSALRSANGWRVADFGGRR